MSRPSVVVIGGGAIGLATAFFLTELGDAHVTVLERDQIASGSSGLSVGIIETQYVDPLDIELRVRSMELFLRLEREHGLGIVRNGYLRLAHDSAQLSAFRQSVAIQRELGVADAVVLDRAEVERLVPDIDSGDLAGGLYGPSDGYIDGHEYCSLLERLVRSRGCTVHTGCALLGADPHDDGSVMLSTRAGPIRCDVVVNAAGAWAARVGEILGAPFTVVPQRHQAVVAHLDRALQYVMPSVMDYTPRSDEIGLYARHDGSSALVAGLHSEERLAEVADPDLFRRSADEGFLEQVARRLGERFPGLHDARLAHGWAGLYPVTPDGLPQVGPNPTRPTVVHAGGAGGAGLQLSPVLGCLAAEWALLGEPRALTLSSRLVPGRPTLTTEVTA